MVHEYRSLINELKGSHWFCQNICALVGRGLVEYFVKNEIDTTDAAIDKIVYALYGLNEEEIKIVEGNF